MNTKSLRLSVLRLFAIGMSLTLLLILATVLWGLAEPASEASGSKLTTAASSTTGEPDAKPAASEESESMVKEAPSDCALASDVLEMEGDWDLTLGYGFPGLTADGSGHYVPSGSPIVTRRVHFDRGERTTYGYRFTGRITYVPSPYGGLGHTFQGETFYDGRGVQVVQMRWEDNNKSGRYFLLLAGSHQPYPGEPRVEVKGGWVDVGPCGALTGAYRQTASFVMVKVPTTTKR